LGAAAGGGCDGSLSGGAAALAAKRRRLPPVRGCAGYAGGRGDNLRSCWPRRGILYRLRITRPVGAEKRRLRRRLPLARADGASACRWPNGALKAYRSRMRSATARVTSAAGLSPSADVCWRNASGYSACVACGMRCRSRHRLTAVLNMINLFYWRRKDDAASNANRGSSPC